MRTLVVTAPHPPPRPALPCPSPPSSPLLAAPVNRPPVVAAVAYSTPRDKALSIAAPGVLANASDADNDPLSASPLVQPANGNLTLDPNGSFVYVPGLDFTGSDNFTFNVTDGQGGYALGVAFITISECTAARVCG
jgi:large repetitive protein